MKYCYTLLFAANLLACRPDTSFPSIPSQSLMGERAGDFTILNAPDFYAQPQLWHIDDLQADLLFVFNPAKKMLEVKTVRFQFADFDACKIWLGPYSAGMAEAETTLDPHFPILPPPVPFLAKCEQSGLNFLATPSENTADRLGFHLSEDFWEAWETGCLDWPWSVHFQFFVKDK